MYELATTWIDMVQLLLVCASLLATVLIAWFVARQTQNHFMVQHSQTFIERFNSDTMTAHCRRVEAFTHDGRTVSELLDSSAADPQGEDAGTHDSHRTVANFFQELGAALQHRMVKESMVWDDFGGLVRAYWQRLLPYIEQVRLRDNRQTLYCDFEELAERMARLDRKKMRHRSRARTAAYVFGYGSLIHPDSIERTLDRKLNRHHLQTCWLNGYRRNWSVYCPVIRDGQPNQPIPAVYLNITPDPAARCNGVCFPVSTGDLQRFDQREKSYRRVEVTDMIQPTPDRPVFTYVGIEPWTQLPADAQVPASYEQLLEQGLAHWPESFREAFARSTTAHQLPRFEGGYHFADPQQEAAVHATAKHNHG